MSVNGFVEIQSWETDFASLPKVISDVFSHEEKEVYSGGSSKVTEVLMSAGESRLISVAEVFENDYPLRVYVDDLFGSPKIWFSLANVSLEHEIRLLLPQEAKAPPFLIPKRLNNLFRSVGALTMGIPYAPILTAPQKDSDENENLHPDRYLLIRYGNGDFVYTEDGREFRFHSHESGQSESVNINEHLDKFIDDLCRKKDWGF